VAALGVAERILRLTESTVTIHGEPDRIKGDASACSSMKILVAGFSQGAHFVGDTIENLTNKNDSSLGHVYGVAL
jgi:hypothetical protein